MAGGENEVLLSGRNLRKIPDDVLRRSDDIRIMDLSENKNICLDGIETFSALTELRLCRCAIRSAPTELFNLAQLTDLDLSGNTFADDQRINKIGELTGLKKLRLGSCKLQSFPDWITNLNQLEQLFVRENDFSKGLNPAIGRLGRLKKLCLRDCQITFLPDTIGGLTQLQDLVLTGNNFSGGLQPIIGQLPLLEKLCLCSCKLTGFADDISNLTQLKELWLSENDLAGVQQLILPGRLKKLGLDGCQLTSLPDCVEKLVELQFLKLNDNMLDKYPQTTLQLRNLLEMDVSNSYGGNTITQLPPELEHTNLASLKLDGNPITQPPKAVWSDGVNEIKEYFRLKRQQQH